ncbi:MAG: hypothetical protein ACERKO_13295, partial [Acetanaerobacterium sp.]
LRRILSMRIRRAYTNLWGAVHFCRPDDWVSPLRLAAAQFLPLRQSLIKYKVCGSPKQSEPATIM